MIGDYIKNNGIMGVEGVDIATRSLLSALTKRESGLTKSSLVLDGNIKSAVERITLEYFQRSLLRERGFRHLRKIFLAGVRGTGKTSLAEVIAGELKIPLFTVNGNALEISPHSGSDVVDSLITISEKNEGVFFLEGLGSTEASHFVNTDRSNNIIIVVDSFPDCTFDLKLHLKPPTDKEISAIIENSLCSFIKFDTSYLTEWLIDTSKEAANRGYTQADVVRSCRQACKTAIINSANINLDELKSYLLQD